MATQFLKDHDANRLDIEITVSTLGVVTMVVVGLSLAIGFALGMTACYTLNH